MAINNFNLRPNTLGKMAGLIGNLGPTIIIPASDADGVMPAATPTLNTDVVLNGAAVVNFDGVTTKCMLPCPVSLVFTCAAAADTFTANIRGVNQYGELVTRTAFPKTQTASATQRDATGACWTRIDSIQFTAYSSAGNISIGFMLPVAADSGQNALVRIPLPFRLVNQTDLLGLYVEDDGGGDQTIITPGAMLKSGVGTFSVLPVKTSTYVVTQAVVTATQPTSAIRLRPIMDPDVAYLYQ